MDSVIKGKVALQVRPHPAKLPTCERKRPKKMFAPRDEQRTEAIAHVIPRGQRPWQAGGALGWLVQVVLALGHGGYMKKGVMELSCMLSNVL